MATQTRPPGGAPQSAPAVIGAPSRLASAPINLAALRDDAMKELVELLEALPGRILLIVDAPLVAPLKLVVSEGARALREHRVEGLVELSASGTLPRQLATASASAGFDAVLYLARPTISTMATIATQVRALARRAESGREARKALHLAFVPRRTFLAEQALRDELGKYTYRRTALECCGCCARPVADRRARSQLDSTVSTPNIAYATPVTHSRRAPTTTRSSCGVRVAAGVWPRRASPRR